MQALEQAGLSVVTMQSEKRGTDAAQIGFLTR